MQFLSLLYIDIFQKTSTSAAKKTENFLHFGAPLKTFSLSFATNTATEKYAAIASVHIAMPRSAYRLKRAETRLNAPVAAKVLKLISGYKKEATASFLYRLAAKNRFTFSAKRGKIARKFNAEIAACALYQHAV